MHKATKAYHQRKRQKHAWDHFMEIKQNILDL